MSLRSFGTSRTPSNVLMITNGIAAISTVKIGARSPRPNQIPERRAQTSDGIAKPTITKSWRKFSTEREAPIKRPTGTPMAKARTKPIPRRRRLIQKACHTVVRATVIPLISSHMNLRTSAGVGMRSVGRSGISSCHTRKKASTEAKRANRGDRSTRMIRSVASPGIGRAMVAMVSAPYLGAT